MQKIVTFLMFEGQAEEAMSFYTSLFQPSEILETVRYGAEGPGPEGSIQKASFVLKGQTLMVTDSFVKHQFSFTPSMSLFVNCDSAEEVDRLFERLSEGGQVMMPVSEYPFSKRFGWVSDRFGVSWQLNLE